MRHQWVFSLVTCLHQVSYHTFYQWVTYDWWEPRPLFSFICDLSERTTGISRLLNSLNAWRQGLTVLIQAGSRVLFFTSGWWEEGQEKKGEGEGGEGRGNSFCEQRQFWLRGFLSPARLHVGKGAFPEPEKADRQNLARGGTRGLCGVGRGGHGVLFNELGFCFFKSTGQILSTRAGLLGSQVRNRGFKLQGVPAFLVIRGALCCLASSCVWRWFWKLACTSHRQALGSRARHQWTCVGRNYDCIHKNVFPFSSFFPYLSYTCENERTVFGMTAQHVSSYVCFPMLQPISWTFSLVLSSISSLTASSSFHLLLSLPFPDVALLAKVVLDLLLS